MNKVKQFFLVEIGAAEKSADISEKQDKKNQSHLLLTSKGTWIDPYH